MGSVKGGGRESCVERIDFRTSRGAGGKMERTAYLGCQHGLHVRVERGGKRIGRARGKVGVWFGGGGFFLEPKSKKKEGLEERKDQSTSNSSRFWEKKRGGLVTEKR